jgi:LmbE family N-acetylglucosaminyl deacetylase
MFRPKRVLVLAPHTDDAELGCGGTLARWLEEGASVHVAVFSTAEQSLPPGSDPNRLREECHKAMDSLGIPNLARSIFNYPVRQLSYHRQEVLEEMVSLGRSFEPEVILLPSGADLHQDHRTVFDEGLKAFKHLTVMGYELPWNHITFSAQAFVVLEKKHLERKWKAMQCYGSQLELNRPYFTLEAVEAMARFRGLQIKGNHAEAFELVRLRV